MKTYTDDNDPFDVLYDSRLDGTANTEFCDCDKMEKKCWWYLPVVLGLIVLAYGLGWVSAAWLIN